MNPKFLLFTGLNLFPLCGGGNLIGVYDDEQSAVKQVVNSELRKIDGLEWAQVVMADTDKIWIRHHYKWDHEAEEWVESERDRVFFENRQKDYFNRFFLGTEDDNTAERTMETKGTL